MSRRSRGCSLKSGHGLRPLPLFLFCSLISDGGLHDRAEVPRRGMKLARLEAMQQPALPPGPLVRFDKEQLSQRPAA